MNYINLEVVTRKYMLAEMTGDHFQGILYLSPRLNPYGRKRYPELLKEAIVDGNDSTLAAKILAERCLNQYEQRGKLQVRVPYNAQETLARGEFNRYYIRALCLRAVEENKTLEVYRAMVVDNPRFESELKIGIRVDPVRLLRDLRSSIGVETALGIPPGPGSGLSVKMVFNEAIDIHIVPDKVA